MAVDVIETGADLLIRNKERAKSHSVAERSSDVDVVMATVASPDELSWSRTLCWAVNDDLLPDGTTRVVVERTFDEVRTFYTAWRDLELTVGTGPLMSDIRSNWYIFSDCLTTPIRNNETGAVREIDSLVLFLMDGSHGISAEICWRRCDDVTMTIAERGTRWTSFLAALREQNVPALMALMSPSTEGAVRDYFDEDNPFVELHGRDAMQAHYEKFFENAEVLDIATVTGTIRDWFVFNELRWVVRLRTGPDRGREVRFLTAEHMAFDGDGLFRSCLGYGTDME